MQFQWYVTITNNWKSKFLINNLSSCVILKIYMWVKKVDQSTIKYKIVSKWKKVIIVYKKNVQYMNIKKKAVGLNNNIKYHGFIFHYNIRADPMSVIGYVTVIWITCSCSACLRKLYSPCNIIQDKYNQGQ